MQHNFVLWYSLRWFAYFSLLYCNTEVVIFKIIKINFNVLTTIYIYILFVLILKENYVFFQTYIIRILLYIKL